MSWEWNTTYTEKERGNAYRLVLRNSEGKGYLEDLGLGGSMTLEWVLQKWDGRMQTVSLAQDRGKF